MCDFRKSAEEASEKGGGLKTREGSASLHIPSSPSTNEKVKPVLTGFGASELRAKQLAATVIEAKLDEEYVKGLAVWVGEQVASRIIYNPARLLVQLVHQLAPVPLPKSVKVPTLNGLQLEVEQKRKFIDVQLPQIIAIEERNLLEAKCERDKQRIQARLEMLLPQQAKEGRNLAKGTAYLADRGIEFSPDHLTGQTKLQQHSDGNIKGGYLYAPTY